MKRREIFGLSLMLVALAFIASAQIHQGRRIVTPRLVADVATVQPGRAFTVGLYFQIEPGWHIYWENSGDAGLPIRVAWALPEGFRVSPLRWPTPRRYTESGGMTAFGYQDEAMVLATVTPPASLPGESVVLEATANWLVCKEVCLPGTAKLQLTLPIGRVEPSAEAELIARFERAVPQPMDRSPIRVVKVEWVPQDARRGTLRLELVGQAAAQEFFPRRLKGATIQHGGVRVSGRSILIPMELEAEQALGNAISGVVVTERGAYELRAALGSVFVPIASERVESAKPTPAESVTRDETSEPEVVPDGSAAGGTNWLSLPFRVRGQEERSHSLAMILLLALLGGIILNITPCVLPVLSIKILGFVHQAGEDHRRVRLMGMSFAAGVLVSLWALALIVIALRATGEQVGWGFQFQSPTFVVAISTVVFIFALNLLGVFEFRSPSVRTRWLEKPGLVGAFFNGVLATTLATPCTAPFLGTAVGFAFAQPGRIIVLVFTAIAVGLALPYVVLSWHPQWLRFVPRPGMWMVRFKQAMGFLLLGALLWLLDVLGSQLGVEAVIWTSVFLLFVAIAAWMIGQLEPHVSVRRRWGTWGLAAALVIGGYVWAFEKELQWREARALASEESATASAEEIEWKPFSLADIERRVRRGETVFIDFTADWCWNCKVNERTVLHSEAVRRKMRELRVTAIRADWTNRNPEITQMLNKFGRSGVPFYVIFPAGRLTEPITLPELLTPGLVIRALEEAGPSRVAGG
ncbi:MAG: protein-disulfide reductase DsbD family protein [Blastocatellia bacterium]|nr:protein-disulfide reductase DsbD family protein [Blastocatellia bacterium]MCS7157302.1 protein-disulfide reductase DsbD family protein [Blastocatellia bacterium]MCX7752022.1 protein-disulfide reductase DsbD family protein [Blastocatellia bacterium]MDW8167127.1 protein-disulfide reductase DsbD family protein [Acidobacteriota bacterium]MDW8257231.1 protein-disulfide reductase DsbD family protein [Acidobacteriota bacterium]